MKAFHKTILKVHKLFVRTSAEVMTVTTTKVATGNNEHNNKHTLLRGTFTTLPTTATLAVTSQPVRVVGNQSTDQSKRGRPYVYSGCEQDHDPPRFVFNFP